ncbi:MAG: formylmethanofuran dehydrogenase subunit A [Azospirillum sp.]|nr:formylmethanofuran dehydrogenase subunit A [Azospirillum sp.]
MLTRFTDAKVFDPLHGEVGQRRDLWVADGRIVAPPPGAAAAETIDLGGAVVMAGAIDLHSHIAGGKVNLARLLFAEDHEHHPSCEPHGFRCGGGLVTPSTFTTGYRYAEMGYTVVVEPAMLASNARHAHLEMADIPNIDTAAYVVLGNDDFLLQLIADGAPQGQINDAIAWLVGASQAIGVKVVNPGGINAFKFNQRRLDLDEAGPYYGATPRRVLSALAQAVFELGIPHPLHVHGCNLGVPGSVDTSLATIAGAEGRPIHLTHLQFHAYGTEGDRKFSSGAARLAEAVNANPNISVDVGQIIFGQTITASGDTMSQYRHSGHAKPGKWILMDIECDAGCGVVPFRYRDKSFVNALQWAIGLELLLLIEDPWRVFLTTDHPNGGPFTCYPRVIRLLMDKDFRDEQFADLHPAARRASILPSIRREYSLAEIAVLTRAAPARILGLRDRGHLGPGAAADLVVYRDQSDREAMFQHPTAVYKDGRLIARDGRVVARVEGSTHVVRPAYDRGIEARLARHFADRIGLRAESFRIAEGELRGGRGAVIHACRTSGDSP